MRPIHAWSLALCNQPFTIGRSLFALCYQRAHFSAKIWTSRAHLALPQARDSPPGWGEWFVSWWRTLLTRFKVQDIVRRCQSVTGQRVRSISLRNNPRRGHTRRPHGLDRRLASARSGDVVKAGAWTACVRVLSLTRCIFRRSETD